MCGIGGVFCPDTAVFDSGDTERRLRAASEALSHRGPDASGVVVRPEERLGFVHRRLAILDLDPRSNQPMASAEGRLLIVFNGEIYNFRELRDQLAKGGAAFHTTGDTEVLLEGYRQWGIEGLLRRISGMFAFGLYDAREKALFLARDRAGKKPLKYMDGPAGLRFCSELRGLLKLSPSAPELDPAGLDAYLSLKFTPPPRTLVRGVLNVPPSCYVEKRAGFDAVTHEYWSPWSGETARPRSPEDAIDRLDAAMTTAVRRRLISDVPVCLFLSGGVDSSLTAAYVADEGVKDMTAYSIGYGDLPAYNEFEYSRLVASKLPVRYEEIVLDSKDAVRTLEDDGSALDEPVSDWVWVPLYHLSRRARQDGFKVALVGEGSDEIFFGYDVMLKGLKQMRKFGNPAWRLAAGVGAPILSPIYRTARRGHSRYDLLRRVAEGLPVYMGSSTGFPRSQRRQIVGPGLRPAGDPEAGVRFIASLYERYASSAPDKSDLANLICWVEFRTKMVEVLLQRVDRVTMLQSLEARSPFLDQDLVELAFAIPGDWKIPNGRLKGLLKQLAARRLPDAVLNRKKMGFSFPFKEWLRGDLGKYVEAEFATSRLFQDGWLDRAYFQDMLREHRGGRIDHAPRLWMVFDLCRWYGRWISR